MVKNLTSKIALGLIVSGIVSTGYGLYNSSSNDGVISTSRDYSSLIIQIAGMGLYAAGTMVGFEAAMRNLDNGQRLVK